MEESGGQARQRLLSYLETLAGRRSSRELWRSEQLESRLGVTRGRLQTRGRRAVSSGSG